MHCELQPGLPAIADSERGEIAQWVQHRIKTLVGISTAVKVFDPDSIERTQTGKARRVFDKRPR
ncbi:Phenylacetate-coenzyme A ligase [compost metagenome]